MLRVQGGTLIARQYSLAPGTMRPDFVEIGLDYHEGDDAPLDSIRGGVDRRTYPRRPTTGALRGSADDSPTLVWRLDGLNPPSSLTSASLESRLRDTGDPVALQYVNAYLAIGTTQGRILLVDVESIGEKVTELRPPNLGLSKVFGGVFSQSFSQPAISSLMSFPRPEGEFLLAINERAHLSIWDTAAAKMLFGVDLLPAEETSLVPKLARAASEPLDALTCILFVYYERRETSTSESGGPGTLHTYEILMEERGNALLKVHVEGGTKLEGDVNSLHDLIIARLPDKKLGAWMRYQNSMGAQCIRCIQIDYTDSVARDMSFSTIEEHALAAVPAAEDLWWWQTFKKLVQHDWPDLKIDQAFVGACVDAILNPACFSIGCLVATLAAIGCSASNDSLHTMSAVELREWIVSVLDAYCADQRRPDTDLCESRDVDWSYFVSCYVKEWTKRFPIVGLIVAQEHQHDQILVARRNDMTTLGLEVFPHGSKQGAEVCSRARRPEFSSLIWTMNAALGGPSIHRVLDAVIQSKGVDLYLHVLPAVERMLSGSSLPIVSASTPDQTCGRRSKLRRMRAQLFLLRKEAARGYTEVLDYVNSLSGTVYNPSTSPSEQQSTDRGPKASRVLAQIMFHEATLRKTTLLGGLVSCQILQGECSDWGPSSGSSCSKGDPTISKLEQKMLQLWAAACIAPKFVGLTHRTEHGLDPSLLVSSLKISNGGQNKRQKVSSSKDAVLLQDLIAICDLPDGTGLRWLRNTAYMFAERSMDPLVAKKLVTHCLRRTLSTPTSETLEIQALLPYLLPDTTTPLNACLLDPDADFSSLSRMTSATVHRALATVELSKDEASVEMARSLLAKSSQGDHLETNMRVELFYGGRPREEAAQYIMAIIRQVEGRLEQAEENSLLLRAFGQYLECHLFPEAYLTAVCIGDSDGVLDCLRQLLQRTVQLKKPDEFNRLPFVGTVALDLSGTAPFCSLQREAAKLLQLKARASLSFAVPNPYMVLFQFHQERGHWQAAASTAYAFAQLLRTEYTLRRRRSCFTIFYDLSGTNAERTIPGSL
ncbi:hypothetical protein ACKKBG_A23995 [Auxenochlorella protothecoides x Auxenochlorella symbiontica]